MTRIMLTALASIVAAATSALPAQATTIDLNMTVEGGLTGPTYSQDGYTLTNSGAAAPSEAYGNWIVFGQPNYNANGSNATLFQNYANTSNTLTKNTGTPFSFQGISLADVYNNGGGGLVSFVFNYAGAGSSTQTVTVDNLPGLQAFTFNQTNLSSVVFTPLTTDGPFLQFDFIQVDGVAGAAPEPGTWAMMILGFGFAGVALRRQVLRSEVKFDARIKRIASGDALA